MPSFGKYGDRYGSAAQKTMNISDILRLELDKRGLQNLIEAARFLGVSTELMRVTLNGKHIPKDSTLAKIAAKLGLNASLLVLTAHRQKLPQDVQGLFLAPVQMTESKLLKRRKWPLSQEQCEYLSALMSNEEIQLIRKYRQLHDEQKTQLLGYIHYRFTLARQDLLAAGATAPAAEVSAEIPAVPVVDAPALSPEPVQAPEENGQSAERPPAYGPRPLILKNA